MLRRSMREASLEFRIPQRTRTHENPRNTSTTTAWKAVVRTYRTQRAVQTLQCATARYSSGCTVTPTCHICANTPLAAAWQHHKADASRLFHRARGTHAWLLKPVTTSALTAIGAVAAQGTCLWVRPVVSHIDWSSSRASIILHIVVVALVARPTSSPSLVTSTARR